MNPQKGTSLQDNFEFIVSGWISNSFPLLIKIKYLDKENNLLDISLDGFGGFTDYKWNSTIIPFGDKFFLRSFKTKNYCRKMQ